MGMLAGRYDALFVDLDGVVYRGDEVVPGAADALDRVRAAGTRVLFITNNSSKTPDEVAGKLRSMGVASTPGDILTSAMATAAMLEREGAAGRSAFVIGERGVRQALEGIGVTLVDGEPERADLVVIGWDRSADYAKLRTAGLLVQRGARLIATNPDGSYPAPDGLWPGAGALLAAVTTTTRSAPTVVGKPAQPLFDAARGATGASHPLVVGDRLDTDISGAAGAGLDSLLVLTGAARPADLCRAQDIPTYVGRDLSILCRVVPPARFTGAAAEDMAGIRELLRSAGLAADGVEERLDHTLVCREVGGTVHGPADGGDEGDEGSLVATACLEQVDGSGILRSVAVRADLRGEGLGLLASAAAIGKGRSDGIATFALFTETAVPFFELLGFRPIERSDLPVAIRDGRHAAEECARSATAMLLTL